MDIGEAFNAVLSGEYDYATNPSFAGFKYRKIDLSAVPPIPGFTIESYCLGRVTPQNKIHMNFSPDHKEIISPLWEVHNDPA